MIVKPGRTTKMVILILLMATASLGGQSGGNESGNENYALIPLDVYRLSTYTDFFFHFPPDDFLYHLNDRLLFLEKPEGLLVKTGVRLKLFRLAQQLDELEKTLKTFKKDDAGNFRLTVKGRRNFARTSDALKLMGLRLEKRLGDHYHISKHLVPKYYRPQLEEFLRQDIRVKEWINLLNKDGEFTLQLRRQSVPLSFDYSFLKAVTGVPVQPETFFRTMVGNEKFSLLLGTLYRLSPRAIDYIDSLQPGHGLWKKIYKDDTFLMGMFILSHALRVENGAEGPGLRLPGGAGAKTFWNGLAGTVIDADPAIFLHRLATTGDGRINYLFTFGSFLPREVRDILFSDKTVHKMRELLYRRDSDRNEKLHKSRIPRFRIPGLFTILFSLRAEKGELYFPGGLEQWLNNFPATSPEKEEEPSRDIFLLLDTLLDKPPRKSRSFSLKQPDRLPGKAETFISLYNKFAHRPGLLTPAVLEQMVKRYPQTNVLIDYIEKIPLRKPETIEKLFQWVDRFNKLPNPKTSELLTAVFQSLFELVYQISRYAPESYDYDQLVNKIIDIPFYPSRLYDLVFQFLHGQLGLKKEPVELSDVILKDIGNKVVEIGGTQYRFMIRDIYYRQIHSIMSMQDVCSFPEMITLNGLLNRLEKWKRKEDSVMNFAMANSFINRVLDICYGLPHAEISDDAPEYIRERVMSYDRATMHNILESMQHNIVNNGGENQFLSLLTQLKRDYLLLQLKDHMLSLIYAVSSKEPRLRLFLNPNLVRLHDFSNRDGKTAWNHCGTPPSLDHFSEYLLTGGLSRLSLSFSVKWRKQILNRTFVYSPPFVEAMTANLMDVYPLPPSGKDNGEDFRRAAKWIESAREILRNARQDESLKKQVSLNLSYICAGFHYRETMLYLEGKRNDLPLFLIELKELGRRMESESAVIENGTGGIAYEVFGNMVNRPLRWLPQDLAMFFGRGEYSGALVDEFVLAAALRLSQKNIPFSLIGHILYSYYTRTAPLLFSQNHTRDYFSGYYLADVFNDSQLENLLKEFQKEGHLKLK